jgi:hypothetical protein
LVLTVFCFCSCHSVRGQQKNDTVEYDSITQQNVYTFVEKMPVYKGGEYAFFADFVKQFHYSFLANEEIQTKLKVQFVIDEKGHLIGARIYNKKADNLTDFEKAGLQALELMQSWEAGSHNNKNVNVILTQVIHLDYRQ